MPPPSLHQGVATSKKQTNSHLNKTAQTQEPLPPSSFVNLVCTASYCLATESTFRDYAFNLPKVLDGDYFRLVTQHFVHLDYVHLGINLLALSQTGPIFDKKWGREGYLKLGTVATLANLATSYFTMDETSSYRYSAGLSMMTCAVRGAIQGTDSDKSVASLVKEFLYVEAPQLLLGILTERDIDHVAHLVGFISGIAFAHFCPPKTNTQSKRNAQ